MKEASEIVRGTAVEGDSNFLNSKSLDRFKLASSIPKLHLTFTLAVSHFSLRREDG